jgi:hypothetical protein
MTLLQPANWTQVNEGMQHLKGHHTYSHFAFGTVTKFYSKDNCEGICEHDTLSISPLIANRTRWIDYHKQMAAEGMDSGSRMETFNYKVSRSRLPWSKPCLCTNDTSSWVSMGG